MGKRNPFETGTAIRSANLTDTEKLVLFVLWTYANGQNGVAFPSAPLLAKGCSLGVSTVRAALKALQRRGVITVQPGTGSGGAGSNGRGKTPRRRIELDRLRSLSGATASDNPPDAGPSQSPQGSSSERTTLQQLAENPPDAGPEPSIHNNPREQTISRSDPSAGASRDGWMAGASERASSDGQPDPIADKRALLKHLGVVGDNAEKIARSNLTAEEIQCEADSVRTGGGARKFQAVLTRRLKNRIGLKPPKRIDPDSDSGKHLGRLEELQRQQHRSRDPGPIADDLSALLDDIDPE